MNSKIKQFKYTSSLSGFIQEHVAEKRALGVLFNTDAKILQNFDRYVLSWDGGTATTITQELADSYSKRRPNEGVAYQLLRIKTVNKLSSYMIRNGIDAYMIPNEKCLAKRNHSHRTFLRMNKSKESLRLQTLFQNRPAIGIRVLLHQYFFECFIRLGCVFLKSAISVSAI